MICCNCNQPIVDFGFESGGVYWHPFGCPQKAETAHPLPADEPSEQQSTGYERGPWANDTDEPQFPPQSRGIEWGDDWP